MMELIKSTCNDKSKLPVLEAIYTLYDQLQYAENLNDMADDVYLWLLDYYNISGINIYLFDTEHNVQTKVLKKGQFFELESELAFFFIINTHTPINAIISFAVSSEEQCDKINSDYAFIEACFFQISPIIQNGILKEQCLESSSLDSVTSVHTRSYLIDRINKTIHISHKQEASITFLMIGIDHFKAVIEEFDYDIGDKVLIELAKVIHDNIKQFDIVARLTGDEFLVALVDLQDPILAIEIAQSIVDKFSNVEVEVNSSTQQVLRKTACIGISSYPQDGKVIDDVLKNADSFLGEAKNNSRSSVAVYTKEGLSTIELF